MNKTIKYVALLTIFSLFIIVISQENFVKVANAEKKSSTSTNSDDGSYAKVIGIMAENNSMYKVVIKVYAGRVDLPEGDIVLTSDVFKKTAVHRSIESGSSVTIKTKMRADEPHTISVELLSREQTFEPPICYQRSKCRF